MRLIGLWRRWPGRALRFTLLAAPLVWISGKVQWAEVGRRTLAAGLVPIVSSLASLFVCICLGAVRWRILLRAFGAERLPTRREILRHTLVANYFNLLPGGVAGEAVRGYRVRAHVGEIGSSYLILLVDRLAGLAGLLVLTLAGAVAGPSLPARGVEGAMLGASVLGLVLSALALGVPFLSAAHPEFRRRIETLPVIGARLAILRPAKRVSDLLLAVALSVGTQTFVIGAILSLVFSLAPGTSLPLAIRVAPAVVLLTFVPITPAAIGQREALFTEFFALAGVAPASAVAAAILWFGVQLTMSALGGTLLLWERWSNIRSNG